MRNFNVINDPQRSKAWFKARIGCVTGSKAAIIYMGEDTSGREDYAMQLALERMTGIAAPEPYVSKEMQRGIEQEGSGRNALEIRDGILIRQTGFLLNKKLQIGISLDGDADDFGHTYEFKCPKSKTHLKYMQDKVIPMIYRPQIMHGIYITGASESTFVSFDDRMPPGLELFSVNVRASDLPMREYEKALLKFLDDVSNMEAKLRLMQRGEL